MAHLLVTHRYIDKSLLGFSELLVFLLIPVYCKFPNNAPGSHPMNAIQTTACMSPMGLSGPHDLLLRSEWHSGCHWIPLLADLRVLFKFNSSIEKWPCLRMQASLSKHVVLIWLCIESLWFVSYHMPCCFGRVPWGFKNPKFMTSEKCGMQFGVGWSGYRAEISLLDRIREENVVFWCPKFGSSLCSGQHFYIPGDPHLYTLLLQTSMNNLFMRMCVCVCVWSPVRVRDPTNGGQASHLLICHRPARPISTSEDCQAQRFSESCSFMKSMDVTVLWVW